MSPHRVIVSVVSIFVGLLVSAAYAAPKRTCSQSMIVGKEWQTFFITPLLNAGGSLGFGISCPLTISHAGGVSTVLSNCTGAPGFSGGFNPAISSLVGNLNIASTCKVTGTITITFTYIAYPIQYTPSLWLSRNEDRMSGFALTEVVGAQGQLSLLPLEMIEGQ
jgi:hypothetical protein